MITDIQADKGVDVAAGIGEAGGKAQLARHDVTSESEWAEIVRRIDKDFGRLDILVNNAGIAVGGMVIDLSLEDFRRQMAVNVDSVFLGTKTSLPLMRKHGGGSIVNISSVAGLAARRGCRPIALRKEQYGFSPSRRAGMRCDEGRDTRELGSPRHHRHADLAWRDAGVECAAGSRRHVGLPGAPGREGTAGRHRERRAVPGGQRGAAT